MTKRQVYQKFVYKIHSRRLRESKWKLKLSIQEARQNGEIVTLADSEILRFIDELNGLDTSIIEDQVRVIRSRIKQLKSAPKSSKNKTEIRKLYKLLDSLQIKPDYLCLIIDKAKDYDRANKGFSINDIRYKRLLATNGGVKKSIIIYVNENLHSELRHRLDNGRNMDIPMNPSKFGAYEGLACSASVPVSYPKRVLVVRDCVTHFTEKVIKLDDTNSNIPQMTYSEESLEFEESDGYGLLSPALSAQYAKEIGESYLPSGYTIRNSFCKGMLFTFDFHAFADKVAKQYVVEDVWGEKHDIRDVDMILTTSMLKLWKCYSGIDDYIGNCIENKHSFSITKVCPKELEHERTLNYQFIQNYKLSEEDVSNLITPTLEEIKGVISGNYAKSILFLRGRGMNADAFDVRDADYVTALMIDKRMHQDPFVRSRIYNLIKKKINDAKIGVVKVQGNYSIVSGDPYSLCQSMFGIPITGLLKKGEFYSKYWIDKKTEEVVCFRAPMSCYNNIRKLKIVSDEEMAYWYQHMNTVTIFNSWDTTAHALNGLDKDELCPLCK